jgi:uncharacterized RDD family membrane protein YckC
MPNHGLMDIEYKIIGGDGAEYGPATLEELRGWIGDGRVAGTTQVWRNDVAHWLPAARYQELHPDLERLHASVSPGDAVSALHPVGFWVRVGAYMIDQFVLMMVLAVLWIPFSNWQKLQLPIFPANLTQQSFQLYTDQVQVLVPILFPYIMAVFVLYDVLMNGTFGATLGKMAIGARILRADGVRLGYFRALIRSVICRLTERLLFLGYLCVALRPDKRGIHDLIAGTRVVYPK